VISGQLAVTSVVALSIRFLCTRIQDSYAREFKIAALFLNGSDEDVAENGELEDTRLPAPQRHNLTPVVRH
jgi:hypothetical protein